MPEFFVILNPASRGGEAANDQEKIREALNLNNVDFELHVTDDVGQGIDLTKDAVRRGFKWIIAAGGDGTTNEVINGLMVAKKEGLGEAGFGVIPIGRGNDFAYGANIPMGFDDAIALITEKTAKTIDIGYLIGGDYPQGRYFGNGVGIGFDAVVGFEAAKIKFLPPGFLSYLVGALITTFLFFKAPLLKIEIDDEVIETKALMVSIMNGRRMGGGFLMAPTAVINDGLLDICLVKQLSKLKILLTIPKFFEGRQVNDPNVRMLSTKKVNIKALKGSLPVHSDGETICFEGEELSIELIPNSLQVISRG